MATDELKALIELDARINFLFDHTGLSNAEFKAWDQVHEDIWAAIDGGQLTLAQANAMFNSAREALELSLVKRAEENK